MQTSCECHQNGHNDPNVVQTDANQVGNTVNTNVMTATQFKRNSVHAQRWRISATTMTARTRKCHPHGAGRRSFDTQRIHKTGCQQGKLPKPVRQPLFDKARDKMQVLPARKTVKACGTAPARPCENTKTPCQQSVSEENHQNLSDGPCSTQT